VNPVQTLKGGEVEGRNFTEWFVNEYMVTNETLYHKNPVTGKPQVIGLGWLDDVRIVFRQLCSA
jgi:hypothetical protein